VGPAYEVVMSTTRTPANGPVGGVELIVVTSIWSSVGRLFTRSPAPSL